MIDIDEHAEEVLDRVMQENGLESREEAFNQILAEFELHSEPELRPEFVKELDEAIKGKHYSREELEEYLEKGE